METTEAIERKWIGKAVSIECEQRLGIFQGIIREISPNEITIIRAFRNGLPLRKQDAEVTLKSTDILKIDLIPSYNGQSSLSASVINKPTPVKLPNFGMNMVNDTTLNGESTSSSSNEIQSQKSQETHWPSNDNNISLTKKLAKMKVGSANGLKSSNSVSEKRQHDDIKGSLQSLSSHGNSVSQFFKNMIPPKVEVRMGSAFSACTSHAATVTISSRSRNDFDSCNEDKCTSVDRLKKQEISSNNDNDKNNNNNGTNSRSQRNGISNNDRQSILNSFVNGSIAFNSSNGNGNGNGNGNNNGSNGKTTRQQRKQIRRENSLRQNRAFATSSDDPLLNEDFDFEGNLALFDKQAIWNVIESEAQKGPEHPLPTTEKKYRHDENILVNEPPKLRAIEALFDGSSDFVTDTGLIIPTIPHFVRSKIEITADRNGLSMQRQFDILGRGATDLAILMLGGARRLTPNNCHQWPRVIIICEKSQNYRSANIGAATGRNLASHGIEVVLYLEDSPSIEQRNGEISLFKATGNSVVYTVNDLPTPDLVILSTCTINLSADVTKWLGENRASVFAVDPPASGIRDIVIKCSIVPILPLNGISMSSCGKLYLCNLGIPEKFYRDAGVKYKSPFGHKFVIPIHPKH